MNERIRDYLEFGVPAVWVVDPHEKRIWIYRSSGLEEAAGNAATVDGTNLTIPSAQFSIDTFETGFLH